MLPDLQLRHLLGGRHRCFLVLIVGALGSTAPAPPREPAVDIFYVDGGCSLISISTSQEVRRLRFLALMVGALGSTALTPPREPTINTFYVDGRCSWISVSTRQGARHRCFLALMVVVIDVS
jgi:hypothetical protein